jgi:TPP-dependent pyruvate/acetoin dehydrogenase alpha subunit
MGTVGEESIRLRAYGAFSAENIAFSDTRWQKQAFIRFVSASLVSNTMQTQLDLYKFASFIRAFELHLAVAAEAGHVPGLLHLCCGAELAELAICAQLTGPKDQVTGSHRSHGLALAMGADPLALAAEILGREGGLSAGRGGTQHLSSPKNGFLTSNGIVGGQVPIAAGAALTAKMLGAGGVAATFFGDGAANQGAVLETMNLAVALELPMVFVMENNGLGQSTSTEYATGGADLLSRATGFGLKPFKIDGFDAADCLSSAKIAVSYVRKSGKPAFVEASVPRLSGHYYGEKADYLATHDERDPIEILAHELSAKDQQKARAKAEKEAHDIVAAAIKLPEAKA